VKRNEAPRGFGDLLDPKWMGKIVKSHPAYSGTSLSVTCQIVRELGWEYLAGFPARRRCRSSRRTTQEKNRAWGTSDHGWREGVPSTQKARGSRSDTSSIFGGESALCRPWARTDSTAGAVVTTLRHWHCAIAINLAT
jgi:hypothetical protein